MMDYVLDEYKKANDGPMTDKSKSDELLRIKGIIKEKIIGLAFVSDWTIIGLLVFI